MKWKLFAVMLLGLSLLAVSLYNDVPRLLSYYGGSDCSCGFYPPVIKCQGEIGFNGNGPDPHLCLLTLLTGVVCVAAGSYFLFFRKSKK